MSPVRSSGEHVLSGVRSRDGTGHGVAGPSDSRRAWGANRVDLNVRKLESLRALPGAPHTEYMDSDLRGFGVRVYASGRRVFLVRFSLRGGRQ